MRWVFVSSPKQQAIAQGGMISSCTRGGSDWKLGKISSVKVFYNIGIGSAEDIKKKLTYYYY